MSMFDSEKESEENLEDAPLGVDTSACVNNVDQIDGILDQIYEQGLASRKSSVDGGRGMWASSTSELDGFLEETQEIMGDTSTMIRDLVRENRDENIDNHDSINQDIGNTTTS